MTEQLKKQVDKMLFVYGGSTTIAFIKYIITLTNKSNPTICYVPTASADNQTSIDSWYEISQELNFNPTVLRTFISSSPEQESFEDVIMSADAIIVGGGNTLNMVGIWKIHGIDTILKKAYEKGIILAGGSAGSLCWFNGGYTDSRPQKLTVFEGLNLLEYSHCPHYSSGPSRRPMYLKGILSGEIKPGYACDDLAGLLFVNGKVTKSISQDVYYNNYFISVKDGEIHEELLPAELIN